MKPVEEKKPSACLVKGAVCTLSAAEKCVPPSSHFSGGLGTWRRCQQSHRISCWPGSSFLHMPVQQQTKREEAAENNCTNHRHFKTLGQAYLSLGLWRDSTLNAQVCPDVFPSSKAVLRNTKHHLLCTFIYMPKTELKRKLL